MAKIYDAEMQYLNVAYAKDVGLNKLGAVTAFESDRITRADAGLSPLLVYSVVAPCYSVWARMLVDAQAPIPISQFLSKAWSIEHGIGMPLRLETETALLDSDQGFVDWASLQGVACTAAAAPKALRSFARLAHELQWSIDWPEVATEGKAAPLLESANKSIRHYDTFSIAISSGTRKSMEHMTFEAWMGRGRRFFNGSWTNSDWRPTCIVDIPRPVPKPHLVVARESDDETLYVSGLKEVVSMWPGGRRAFFKGLGVSAADFDHWAAGRAHLQRQALGAILMKAGAGFDHRDRCYVLSGGNLLVARAPKAVHTVFNELSHGGDLEFGFEITAPPGEEIPFRVLVFSAWGGRTNLILFPRDGRTESLLDGLDLLNMNQPRGASPEVWETLRWISEHRDQLDTPHIVGLEFGLRHQTWLAANC